MVAFSGDGCIDLLWEWLAQLTEAERPRTSEQLGSESPLTLEEFLNETPRTPLLLWPPMQQAMLDVPHADADADATPRSQSSSEPSWERPMVVELLDFEAIALCGMDT